MDVELYVYDLSQVSGLCYNPYVLLLTYVQGLARMVCAITYQDGSSNNGSTRWP
jgi:hypothetical protein